MPSIAVSASSPRVASSWPLVSTALTLSSRPDSSLLASAGAAAFAATSSRRFCAPSTCSCTDSFVCLSSFATSSSSFRSASSSFVVSSLGARPSTFWARSATCLFTSACTCSPTASAVSAGLSSSALSFAEISSGSAPPALGLEAGLPTSFSSARTSARAACCLGLSSCSDSSTSPASESLALSFWNLDCSSSSPSRALSPESSSSFSCSISMTCLLCCVMASFSFLMSSRSSSSSASLARGDISGTRGVAGLAPASLTWPSSEATRSVSFSTPCRSDFVLIFSCSPASS
mmetsp:Transcript_54892/g.161377  ORF Transcript_54892/g.161377 Transcript_54892/m.161377 type:complete len:290 (+) Transcript_54892:1468-2337(+)